ncbi:hypothetical protein ABZP36_035855 [Zizania latifolia]
MGKLRYSCLLVFGRFVLFLSAICWVPAATADALAGQRPGCPSKCGDVDIPFPFGIGEQCAMQTGFQFYLDCLSVDGAPKRPFFNGIEVTKISVEDGKAWMKLGISTQCYDQQTGNMTYGNWHFDFDGSPFWLSADNKIIVIGCKTIAYMQGNSYVIGCYSICTNTDQDKPTNGSCSGNGCCQADVPKRVFSYNSYFNNNYNTTEIWKSSPCSYMAVIDNRDFHFSTTYLNSTVFNDTYKGVTPVVLDWLVTEDTCEKAKSNTTSYACVSTNSTCVDDPSVGYRCKCDNGFKGNPYIKYGCQDIDECLDSATCHRGICNNTMGGFTCTCHRGNYLVNGTTCLPNPKPRFPLPGVATPMGHVHLFIVTYPALSYEYLAHCSCRALRRPTMGKLRYSLLLLFGRLVPYLAAISWIMPATADVPGQRPAGCPSKCGDVDIPFPFGIGKQCAMQTGFQFDLKCLPVDGAHKRPFFGGIEVTKISVEDGKAWMKLGISTQCYDQQTGNMTYNDFEVNLDGSPMVHLSGYRPITKSSSSVRFIHSFFSLKRKTVHNAQLFHGLIVYFSSQLVQYVIGCYSTCDTDQYKPMNGSCSGNGCCQADVPKRVFRYNAYFNQNYYNTTEIWRSSPCSYMAVIDSRDFQFSTTYFSSTVFNGTYKGETPVVLDWVLAHCSCLALRRPTMRKLRYYCLLLFGRVVSYFSAMSWIMPVTADLPAGQRPGCPSKCGDVDIPFPFGIGDPCAIYHGFNIVCNQTVNGTNKPFIGSFEVTKISLPDAKAWMKMKISRQCYDQATGKLDVSTFNRDFTGTPFRLSYDDNKIYVIGCNTMGYIRGVKVAYPHAPPVKNQKMVLALAQDVVKQMFRKT